MFLCAHLKLKMLNWLLRVERHSVYVTVLLCVFVLCCDSCLLIVGLHVPVQGTATPHYFVVTVLFDLSKKMNEPSCEKSCSHYCPILHLKVLHYATWNEKHNHVHWHIIMDLIKCLTQAPIHTGLCKGTQPLHLESFMSPCMCRLAVS